MAIGRFSEDKKTTYGQHLRSFAIEVAIASTSNMLGTAFGHPLDTIRVRCQMESMKVPMLRTIKDTYKGEGLPGFYKGMMSPIVA